MAKRRFRGGRKSLAHLAIILSASAAAPLYAQEQVFDWSIDAGAEYSDNVRRSPAEEQSETIGTAGVQLSLETDKPRLDTRIGVDAEYRKYLDDAFDDEVVGGADASLAYAFAPERFIWVVQDNFGQLANDRAFADTPENRENFNYFSTGPDLVLPLGSRTSVNVRGRWSQATYENDEQNEFAEDTTILLGSLGLVRQLSDVSSLSLNGEHNESRFEGSTQFDDFEIQQGFLRYELATMRTELSIDAGYTTLEQAGETSDGPLARLEFTRRVAARSRLTIQGGTEFSTTPNAFRRVQDLVGPDADRGAALAASDAFRNDYASLIWITDWPRSGFAIELSAGDESYETFTELDRETLQAVATWSREMTRIVSLSLRAGYLDEKYVETGVSFDELSAGVGLDWRLTRQFSIVMRVDHFEGTGVDGERDYDENRAFLGLSYGRGAQ